MRTQQRHIVVVLLLIPVLAVILAAGQISYSQVDKKSMSQKIKEAIQKRDSVEAEQKFQVILDSLALYKEKEDTALYVREHVVIKEVLDTKASVDKVNQKAYRILVSLYMKPNREKMIFLHAPVPPKVEIPRASIKAIPERTPEIKRSFWDHILFRN